MYKALLCYLPQGGVYAQPAVYLPGGDTNRNLILETVVVACS